MTELTIKERILKVLLESPKTTGEIAKMLGYVNEKGVCRYNNVKTDLNTLQSYGFIHYYKTKKQGIPGPPPTTYDIVYEYDVLREILKKYKSLISDLQKSDKILSMLADSVQPDTFFELLKDMLRLSPSLFENFLMNDSFLTKWVQVLCEIRSPGYITGTSQEALREYLVESTIYDLISRSFEHCVIEDLLKGVSTPEELNMLNDLKRGLTIKGKQINRFEVVQV